MSKKNIILTIIVVIVLLTSVVLATYAYFANAANTNNIANVNAITEQNNMVFDTLGGELVLNVTAGSMAQAVAGNVADQNTTTLTVNFTANTDYDMVCSYDIVYEWTSQDKYQAHTTGVTANEFTVQASLTNNAHVYAGTNSIESETDLATAVGNQISATVVSGAQIDSNGVNTSTAVWTIGAKFYNVDANQSSLADKNYTGRFKVTNVSCVAGTVSGSVASFSPTSYWFELSHFDDLNSYWYPFYTFPYNGPSLVSSGGDTESNVYMGQDNSKLYICGSDGNGHEACLSLLYAQYGLGEHIEGQDFSESEQAIGKAALYQLLSDAGMMNGDINSNCTSTAEEIGCWSSISPHKIHFAIRQNSIVTLYDWDSETHCELSNDNEAAFCQNDM